MNTESSAKPENAATRFEWDGVVPPRPADPPSVPIFKMLYRASRRSGALDIFLSSFLKYRYYLPTVSAEDVIPEFATSQVTVRDLPRGLWATPLVDTLSVVKTAIGFGAKKILEIGSYRGATARLLAENTPPDTHIWTLDIDPNHGEFYRGTEFESRIHRLVGRAENELLTCHGPFNMIFVDADHDYESVFHHSAVAFQNLAAGGVILWHDYQQNNYLHGGCAVPEALHAASLRFHKNILAIEGTMLGIYSEAQGWETRHLGMRHGAKENINPWTDEKIRKI